MDNRIIIVYDLDSGLMHRLLHFWYRCVSPKSDKCRLYALTSGLCGMKKEWKSFLRGLPVKTDCLYKNKFLRRYASHKFTYPVVLNDNYGELTEIIPAQKLKEVKTLDELTVLVRDAVKGYVLV